MANKENIRKWVEALRSGEYRQGRKLLRVGDRFCCLGVACDVSNVGEWQRRKGITFEYEEEMGMLPPAVCDWLGVASGDPVLYVSDKRADKASQLNDRDHFTFSQIADAIERTYLTGDA